MSIGEDPEMKAKLQEEFNKVLKSLTDQEKKIIREKFEIEVASLSPEQINEKLEFIRARIKEVELKALAKLRQQKGPEEPA